MNKVWLIVEREYLERVKKRSFLLATLLTPLIFPLIGGIAYLATRFDSSDEKVVLVVDESALMENQLTAEGYTVTFSELAVGEAKQQIADKKIYGVLYIPSLDLESPKGIEFYSETSPGFGELRKFKEPIREKIRTLKIAQLNLDKEIIDRINPSFDINTFSVTETGEEKKSSSTISSGMGYIMAFLIYMFVFVYGSFIMQSVLNEKTNKIVEVIVSSVKPFQLMLGKVLGVGAVALTQFVMWIVILGIFTSLAGNVFAPTSGMEGMPAAEMAQQAQNQTPEMIAGYLDVIQTLPITQIIILFLIYFTGGFFLFGALFAAVGSAVDSLQEAQQFTLPISLPIIASLALMGVVLNNPNGTSSVILTLIPFTSPVLMMARIPFGVPMLQIIASVVLLILGALFCLWLAGKIYRIGILTSGSKVTYKTLAKWIMMKN